MNKTLNKFITAFHYSDKELFVLWGTAISVSHFSFNTIIGAAIDKASARVSVGFLISNGQNFFENNSKEKNKHRKTTVLARSKLNSIYKKIRSKVHRESDISHDECNLIIHEEEIILG